MKATPETRPLPEEEIRRLVSLAQQGDVEARNRVLLANTGLRLKIASRFLSRRPNPVLDVDDLASHAMLGEIKAIERFDGTLGFMFNTYAGWWIRQSIRDAMRQYGGICSLPCHAATSSAKVRTAMARGLDFEEACDRLEVNSACRATIRCAMRRVEPIASWNHPSRNDDPELIRDEARRAVRDALDSLGDRRAYVLAEREEGRTLKAIAADLGVTKERVRQIEVRAMREVERYIRRHCESLAQEYA